MKKFAVFLVCLSVFLGILCAISDYSDKKTAEQVCGEKEYSEYTE